MGVTKCADTHPMSQLWYTNRLRWVLELHPSPHQQVSPDPSTRPTRRIGGSSAFSGQVAQASKERGATADAMGNADLAWSIRLEVRSAQLSERLDPGGHVEHQDHRPPRSVERVEQLHEVAQRRTSGAPPAQSAGETSGEVASS